MLVSVLNLKRYREMTQASAAMERFLREDYPDVEVSVRLDPIVCDGVMTMITPDLVIRDTALFSQISFYATNIDISARKRKPAL